MYSIFVGDTCIYDDTSDELSLKLLSATLTLEDNSAGSLEMTLPITNVGYGSIERMRSHIVVKREGTKIWGGRPLSESEDFYKNKTIFCEGELAYLNDTYQPLEEYYGLTLRQFIEVILHVHNNKCNGDCRYTSYSNKPTTGGDAGLQTITIGGVNYFAQKSTYDFFPSYTPVPTDDDEEEEISDNPGISDGNGEPSSVTGHLDKRIYVGSVTVHDTTNNEYRSTSYTSTMQTLADIVERLGGHMRVRTGNDGKLYLDYLRDFPNRSNQTVQLSKNLLDYRKDYDMSSLCTVLLPLGAKKGEGAGIGDEIKTHWNRRSYFDSVGRIRYGKYFHITRLIPAERVTRWVEYDSLYGTFTEKTTNNRVTYTGEQVAGHYYVYFYNNAKVPISGSAVAANANAQNKGTVYVQGSVITIPEGTAYVRFGFYFGGKDHTRMFVATITQGGSTFRYTAASDKPADSPDENGLPNTKQLAVANYIINSDGSFGPSLDDTHVVSKPINVKPEEVYYITTRQDGGRGMYCVYLKNGTPITSPTMAASGVGFTDWEKNKVVMPAGAAYFIVGGKTDVGLNPVINGSYTVKSESYGQPDEYITIEDVNNGNLYIQNQDLIRRYGWIEKQVVWDDMETPEQLLVRANEYLSITQFDEMILEVKAYDMHLVDQSANPIGILDKVQCISSPHDLDRTLPVTKLEIPLLDPANATYTLGEETATPSLSGSTASSNSELFKKLSEVPTPSAVLNSAKANATEILNMNSSSYISVEPDEILLMDAPDKESATRLWRLNVNGIGYSEEGYAGTFGLAMTMDGSIVADRITTGYLHADRIRGGVLTLGGYDNTSGEFYMENELGKRFVEMTKDGAKFFATISQAIKWGDSLAPKYGYLELKSGVLTGYTARLKGKAEGENSTDWFDNYTFSFDDISSKSAKTQIQLMENTFWNKTTEGKFGINIAAGDGLTIRFNRVEVKDQPAITTPHLIFNKDGVVNFIFGKASNKWCGIRYAAEDFADFSSDLTDPFMSRTLTIRNDAGPSGVLDNIGVGGVYLQSQSSNISLKGRKIFIEGTSDINIKRGNTVLTDYSGWITFLTGVNGNGTFNTMRIRVSNGFISEVSGSEGDFTG